MPSKPAFIYVTTTVVDLVSSKVHLFGHHLYSIWLFTASDIKSIAVPKTMFGIVSTLAAPSFGLSGPPPLEVIQRIPITFLWVWINLLLFCIENQKNTSSINEDAVNKPWRPLPSGRMTRPQARKLLIWVYAAAAAISWQVGGLPQCLFLMVLGYWYNNLGGGNNSCILRNLINGLGYDCFASGATEVAFGRSMSPYKSLPVSWESFLSPERREYVMFWEWIGLLILTICTTTHAQDMYDQEGDRLRGRRSVPLVIGDYPARVSIMAGVAFWSIICCVFWETSTVTYAVIGVLATLVAFRTYWFRTAKSDKVTFLLWNSWLTAVYMLPLSKRWF